MLRLPTARPKLLPLVLSIVLATSVVLLSDVPSLLQHLSSQTRVIITQTYLTDEGLGAGLMHLRQAMALADALHPYACVQIPKVDSAHGYQIADFFPKCVATLSRRRRKCKVRVVPKLKRGKKVLGEKVYEMKVDMGESEAEPSEVEPSEMMKECEEVELIDPPLRDYDNLYNATGYLRRYMQVRQFGTWFGCGEFEAVYHYRYGDIENNEQQKLSKQVPENYTVKLIGDGIVREDRLLVWTDEKGARVIREKMPRATFFTRNEPALLKGCGGRFVGGGSTYAYLLFQMLNPSKVYTVNLKAPSRARFPPGITVDITNITTAER